MILLAPGLELHPAHFSRAEQEALVEAIREIVRAAPRTLSVRILWMNVGMSMLVGHADTQGASTQ